MYGTSQVVLTDVLSNCSLFLNSKIYIFINVSFDHECTLSHCLTCSLHRQDVGTKIVASARCKLAEHFRFHSCSKTGGYLACAK